MTIHAKFRIHHVAISVEAINESIAFYEVFGFQEVLRYVDPDGGFEVAHLKVEDFILEVWCYAKSVPPPDSALSLSTDLPRIGVKHFALEVNSVREAKRYIENQNIPVEVDLREGNTGVSYFFVKDPSGNLLEILEDKRGL